MQTAPLPTQPPIPRTKVLSGVLVGLSFRPIPPSITLQVDGVLHTFAASPELIEYALRFRGVMVDLVVITSDTARAFSVRSAGDVTPPAERSADHLNRWAGVLQKLA